MAHEMMMRREYSRLVPMTPHDLEILEQLSPMKPVTVLVRQSRSPRHHRFFWALLAHVCKGHPVYQKAEQLHLALKYSLGYFDKLTLHDGEVIPIVSSTSFAKMDQVEFKAFFDDALQLILSEIVPDVRRRDLLAPVEQMLGMSYGDLWSDNEPAASPERRRPAGQRAAALPSGDPASPGRDERDDHAEVPRRRHG